MINYSQLKKFFVSSNDDLATVIKIINSNGKGVALVVDNNQTLKGLLTDGDIRRLLLKGAQLSEKIKDKFNKNFFFVKKKKLFNINLEEIKKFFLTSVEKINKKLVRKSIIASKIIKKGDKFTEKNIKCKRPGGGKSPNKWLGGLGKVSKNNYQPDDYIKLK